MSSEWINYHGALILDRLPYSDNKDITPRVASEVLKIQGGYFARWTTDFDCKQPTKWWYCVCDSILDISKMSSKQRYRIKKGFLKNKIWLMSKDEVENHLLDIYKVYQKCNEGYGKTGQEKEFQDFIISFRKSLAKSDIWGVIDCESDIFIGYAICIDRQEITNLSVVKVLPDYLNNEANAALAYSICQYYLNVKGRHFVYDGERNIRHNTNYQDYLVKNIGFRYAYCHLHIVYKPFIGLMVKMLYPIKTIIGFAGRYNSFLFNLHCVLIQESYRQSVKF